MKIQKQNLLWVVLATALLLPSCGHLAQMQDPQNYSRTITAPGTKPLHIGKATPIRDGVYHVQSYDRSVVFMATSNLIIPSQVGVYDLDNDGTFDVVYVKKGKDVWSIGFTKEFRSMNKTIPNSLSGKEVWYWIFRANEVKNSIAQSLKLKDRDFPIKKSTPPKKAKEVEVKPKTEEKPKAETSSSPPAIVEVVKKEEVPPPPAVPTPTVKKIEDRPEWVKPIPIEPGEWVD